MEDCQPGRICSLSSNEMGERMQAWRSLNQAGLLRRMFDEQGLTLVYRRSGPIERQLEELVGLEQTCCGDGGLQFSLAKQKSRLSLRVTLSEKIQGRREALEILSAFASASREGISRKERRKDQLRGLVSKSAPPG